MRFDQTINQLTNSSRRLALRRRATRSNPTSYESNARGILLFLKRRTDRPTQVEDPAFADRFIADVRVLAMLVVEAARRCSRWRLLDVPLQRKM